MQNSYWINGDNGYIPTYMVDNIETNTLFHIDPLLRMEPLINEMQRDSRFIHIGKT